MNVLRALAQMISTTSRTISRLVEYVCVGIVYVMLGLLVTQILMRYFLGAPPSWTEEVAITLFAWLVLLYATVGFRDRFHVAIETIPAHFHRLRAASEWLVSGLVLVFGYVTLTAGLSYVDRTSGQKSAALQWPIEALYLCVPVCGALFILHAVATMMERGTSEAAT